MREKNRHTVETELTAARVPHLCGVFFKKIFYIAYDIKKMYFCIVNDINRKRHQ